MLSRSGPDNKQQELRGRVPAHRLLIGAAGTMVFRRPSGIVYKH